MPFWKLAILAVIQGLAELLPVSSSAHVVVAEKFMGLDPKSPPNTLLLVLLHTGTMAAVIVYFWNAWRKRFFASKSLLRENLIRLGVASFCTAIVGGALIKGIEHWLKHYGMADEVETLFDKLGLLAAALFAAGLLILYSGLRKPPANPAGEEDLGKCACIGAVQGLCLPFRGFSRSGATISTSLLLGIAKSRAEEFSFALAVILTPAAIVREVWRVHKTVSVTQSLLAQATPGLIGMVLSFLAGLIALKWLSRWLEKGRWHYFGIYCLIAAVAVAAIHFSGRL